MVWVSGSYNLLQASEINICVYALCLLCNPHETKTKTIACFSSDQHNCFSKNLVIVKIIVFLLFKNVCVLACV